MITVGPIARIVVRYGMGMLFGAAVSDAVLNDPDLMNFIGIVLSMLGSWAIERVYQEAKKRGWAT